MQIDYLEVPAPELAATKAFYAEAFGWTFVDYGPSYATCEDHLVHFALNGLATVAPAPPAGDENSIGPLPLMSTDDLEAAITAVTGAGGEVVSGPYPYPGGNRFHYRDPSGNIGAVFQSS